MLESLSTKVPRKTLQEVLLWTSGVGDRLSQGKMRLKLPGHYKGEHVGLLKEFNSLRGGGQCSPWGTPESSPMAVELEGCYQGGLNKKQIQTVSKSVSMG